MKTIKSFLFVIALLVGITVNAQDKPVTFGVKAGLNLSNVSGENEHGDAKIGFNAGVTLDFGFTSDVYLLTGLQLTTKGFKYKDLDATSNLIYLQLPVHFGYKLAVTETSKIIFHAGPYAAYGIGGKTEATIWGHTGKGDSFQDGAYKKLDFGVGLGIGTEFGKIGLDLGYDFGLAKINDTSGDGKLKNMNAYLTLGYKF